MEKSVSTSTRDLQGWKIDSAGSIVKKLIQREIYYENVFVLVNVLLAVITGIAFAVPDDTDKDFFLPYVVFEKFFPIFGRGLSLWCQLNFLFVTTIMTTPFHMIIYFCGHTTAQLTMFVTCLENLDYGYNNVDPLKSIYDDEYQNEVTKRLKFCIDRHVRIQS